MRTTQRRVHWPRRVRPGNAIESIDLLCGLQHKPGLTTHTLSLVTCGLCRARLQDRGTRLEAIADATKAERQAAGQCRHCGGPVPCWSAFFDVAIGQTHLKQAGIPGQQGTP
jgi:hypothetical protein